ncbi:MAG: DUF998 domain-containing protein [Candidatus Heimdallarchaeota archaeon]|nr:DUF998 domain-containing protein [Candidatus Heimdallarchaeota archaeon]MCK4291459.1 DUF998 domain-containing protein [Candidatus Heimdallarchaeota archaeon]
MICICGSFLFLLNNFLASLFYKGGSHADPNNPGYSFLWNYVSDLGRTISISGEVNLISRIIFTTTLVIVGFSAFFYCIVISSFYKRTTLSKHGTVVLIFGVLNGIVYIIIGFLPIDTQLLPHNVFVVFAFFFKIILMVFLIRIILRDENYPNVYAYIFLSYLCVFLLFIVFLIFSLFDILVPYLQTSIIGQKLTFYLEAVLYIIQAFGAFRYLKVHLPNISGIDFSKTSN